VATRLRRRALINNSRVTRGGLTALTGAEGTPALIAALQYEQEIEFMGQASRRSSTGAARLQCAGGGWSAGVRGWLDHRDAAAHARSRQGARHPYARGLHVGGPTARYVGVGGKRSEAETPAIGFRALQNARPGYLTRFLPSAMRF